MKLSPKIIEEKVFTLLGCVYYGDPFHSAEPWSQDNEIGKTWERFGKLYFINSRFLDKIIINPKIGYEVHIESRDYRKTKSFHIFVGMEVKNTEFVPIEMFIKILPRTKYAYFTTKGDDYNTCEYAFQEWLPKSKFEQSFPYIIEAYEEGRYDYQEMDDQENEIDWYIPIKVKKQEKTSDNPDDK